MRVLYPPVDGGWAGHVTHQAAEAGDDGAAVDKVQKAMMDDGTGLVWGGRTQGVAVVPRAHVVCGFCGDLRAPAGRPFSAVSMLSVTIIAANGEW